MINKRFRAGYDFLLLRNTVGETDLDSLCEWWTDIQTKNKAEQENMCALLGKGHKKPKRRNNRRRSKTGNKNISHGASITSSNSANSE